MLIILYFWINGLETTEEECFTPQQKVFVTVFSISFSLARYLVFNSAYSPRVRVRSYTNYRHSFYAVYTSESDLDWTRQFRLTRKPPKMAAACDTEGIFLITHL